MTNTTDNPMHALTKFNGTVHERINALQDALSNSKAHCDDLAAVIVQQAEQIKKLRAENALRREFGEAATLERIKQSETFQETFAESVAHWWVQHDMHKPIDPSCVCELLDWLVADLKFDRQTYTQLFESACTDAANKLASIESSDAIKAAIDKVRAQFPHLEIQVMRVKKPH